MKTLILTTCVGYPEVVRAKFLKSLDDTGYEGSLYILDNLPEADFETFMLQRVKAYSSFLDTTHIEYDTVIVTDLRDVLFQRDPSTIAHSDLDFFLEDESMSLRSCPHNSQKIIEGFGQECLDNIGENFISCAGVVIGSLSAMRNYYRQMLNYQEINNANDQAIHNFLLYSDIVAARTVKNEEGDVYTLHYSTGITVFKHKIYNKHGKIPAIVHQYDRHLITL